MKDEPQTDQAEPENVPESLDENAADQAPGGGNGDFGALWILIVVVVMAGATAWMIRDVWTAGPVASGAPADESPAAAHESADAPAPSRAVPVAGSVEAADGGRQNEKETTRVQDEARLHTIEREAERVEQERFEAEQAREAERAARAALEQERLAAEQRLEAERQARMALEAQRLQAERELARERAERKALEQEAQLEQQKLTRARQAAEQAARERAQAEAQLEQQKSMRARQAAEQAARERAQAEAQRKAIEESAATPVVAIPGPPAVESDATEAPETSSAAQAGSEPADNEQTDSDGTKFSSNPCTGPSARFLSTCR